MPQLIFLPHDEICPDGAVFEVEKGTTICDAAIANGIEIEHACEKSCACTTCHVIIREGIDSLQEAEELEEDMLDFAFEPDADRSRLTCQIKVTDDLDGLVVNMPEKQI
mgnify:CR=1 FL=1